MVVYEMEASQDGTHTEICNQSEKLLTFDRNDENHLRMEEKTRDNNQYKSDK